MTREDLQLKRLCKYLLSEGNALGDKKDELLMCISPLHKEILSSNPSLRGDAIRLLSSLTMPEISNIFLSTINKIITDRNS